MVCSGGDTKHSSSQTESDESPQQSEQNYAHGRKPQFNQIFKMATAKKKKKKKKKNFNKKSGP